MTSQSSRVNRRVTMLRLRLKVKFKSKLTNLLINQPVTLHTIGNVDIQQDAALVNLMWMWMWTCTTVKPETWGGQICDTTSNEPAYSRRLLSQNKPRRHPGCRPSYMHHRHHCPLGSTYQYRSLYFLAKARVHKSSACTRGSIMGSLDRMWNAIDTG